MDFNAGQRETITEVYAGDLVIVRLEHRDGQLAPDKRGQLPHLVYKPFFAGEDILPRRRQHLRGEESTTPEWHLDLAPLWAPVPGMLAIEGGVGDARFHVRYTVEHCRADPHLEHTLSFFRVDGSVPRPRGAGHVRVADPVTVRLGAAGYSVNVPMIPGEHRYPLGFAMTVEPLWLTSLFFGIVL
ncbi:MAG: hypothetical protein R3B70_25970 [Polyangiaceae bacterium]